MATLNVTFAFLADAQSFVGTPGVATTMTWDGTVGNPLGSLKSIQAGSNRSDNNSWDRTTTYESLGVPAGSQITGITTGSLDSRCTAFASGTGCTSGMALLVDGANTATLSNQRAFSATDVAFVTTTGTDLTGLALPSSNSITLTIRNHLGTTSGGSGKGVTLYQDNLNFTIVFVPAVADGVNPLIGGRSQGKIGRIGPMRPGMSRFWQPQTVKRQATQPPNPSTDYPITASTGSFTETGTAAGLAFGHAIVAVAGAFTETGTAAALAWAHRITASAGSFVVTGTDATLVTTQVSATGGVHQPFFTIPGSERSSQSVRVRPGWASQGEIGRPGPALPGMSRFHQAVGFRAGKVATVYTLTGDLSSFTLTGSDATLSQGVNPAAKGLTRPISDGSLPIPILSSQGVKPRPGWTSQGEIGRPGPGRPGLSRIWQYRVTAGRSGPFLPLTAYTITASAGSFVWTGMDIPGIVNYTINALPGAFLVNIPTQPPVSLTSQRILTASAGSFIETGQTAFLVTGPFITATTGAFFHTGLDADMDVNRRFTASAGSFVETGTAAILTYSAGVAATSGGARSRIGWRSQGEIGRPGPARPGMSRFWQRWQWSPLSLPRSTRDYPITASAGSFLETGSAAGLAVAHKLTASAGSFVATGTVAILVNSSATARSGVYQPFSFVSTSMRSATGVLSRPGWTSPGEIGRPGPGLPGLSRFWRLPSRNPVAPTVVTYTLTASAGSFLETGTDAGLKTNHQLTASAGSFVETGLTALMVAPQSSSVGGVLPRPRWTAPGSIGRPGPNRPGLSRFWQSIWRNQTARTTFTTYSLTASSGSFVETGTAAALTSQRRITATAGSFIETGNVAAFTDQRRLIASAGSFVLTGKAVGFDVKILASVGTFIETGIAAGLIKSRNLTATAGSFVVTGSAVGLSLGYKFTATAGSFIVAGTDAAITTAHPTANTGVLPRVGWASQGEIGHPGPALPGMSRFWQRAWRNQTRVPVFYTFLIDVTAYTVTGTNAALTGQHLLTANAGAFVATGTSATFTIQHRITASAGSFIVTGLAATFTSQPLLTASAGTFVETGKVAPLTARRFLTASAGSFVETGLDATFNNQPILTASRGSFVLTGNSATFTAPRLLTASAGAFVLTGNAAILAVGLPASPGIFHATGIAATLAYNRTLTVAAGSFVLTGKAVGFDVKIIASAGSFLETGLSVTFARQRGFTAAIRTYLVTGKTTTTLTFGHVFVASPGSFVLTGKDIFFSNLPLLNASAGSFVETGTAATLARNPAIIAAAGSFIETGPTVPLVADRKLLATAGSFALTGSIASLDYGYRITATAGSFTLTGSVAGLAAGRKLTGSAGGFVETGLAATLTFGLTPVTSPGVFLVTDGTATLTPVRILVASPGVFLVTGLATSEGELSLDVIIPHSIKLASAHIEIRSIKLKSQ